MVNDERTPDARYHHSRAEQERHLARRAETAAARACHAELMRLHESIRDGSPTPG